MCDKNLQVVYQQQSLRTFAQILVSFVWDELTVKMLESSISLKITAPCRFWLLNNYMFRYIKLYGYGYWCDMRSHSLMNTRQVCTLCPALPYPGLLTIWCFLWRAWNVFCLHKFKFHLHSLHILIIALRVIWKKLSSTILSYQLAAINLLGNHALNKWWAGRRRGLPLHFIRGSGLWWMLQSY